MRGKSGRVLRKEPGSCARQIACTQIQAMCGACVKKVGGHGQENPIAQTSQIRKPKAVEPLWLRFSSDGHVDLTHVGNGGHSSLANREGIVKVTIPEQLKQDIPQTS